MNHESISRRWAIFYEQRSKKHFNMKKSEFLNLLAPQWHGNYSAQQLKQRRCVNDRN